VPALGNDDRVVLRAECFGDVLEEDDDIKFLGLTLFALVPNITEFMNAMSFAIYGNIALRYECYKYQY